MIAAMTARAEPRFATGLLMLADISGYTSFLQRVTEAHPELDEPASSRCRRRTTSWSPCSTSSRTRLQPMFTPVQTEGDALFAVADADS